MDWNWSFKAFRLFGTDVRIHWSLPAFLIYYVMRAASMPGYTPFLILLFVLVPMALLFFSVIVHEYGHVFAARHFGQRTDYMILTPIGGMVMVAQGRTPWSEFVVAFAGPAMNLALAAIGTALYFAIGGIWSPDLFLPIFGDGLFGRLWAEQRYVQMILSDFVQTNVILFLFNVLLTAYPMDGGRMLLAALWKKRGFHSALVLSCKIARVIAGLIALAGLFLANLMMMFIGGFVFFQAQTTMKRASLMPDPSYGYAGGGGYRSSPSKPKGPGFFAKWKAKNREKKIRALLAKAEIEGIQSLTEAERDFLTKARELN